MQFLVLGGTGFIGPHVIRELVARGHSVAVFHRGKSTPDLPASAVRLHGDRQQLADSVRDFERLAPEVVIDMVGYTEKDGIDLVRTFQGMASRLVVISSMDVYATFGRVRRLEEGERYTLPCKEDAPLRKVFYPYRSMAKPPEDLFYNYDKIHVERAVSNVPNLPTTILRLPAVYGPGDPFHRLFEYLKRMDDGRSAILVNETRSGWRWTRGYVENVAGAIALAAVDSRAAGQIYNVGEKYARTESEWVRSIGRAAGWVGKIYAVPEDQLPAHLKTPHDWGHDCVCDSEKIRRDLGFKEPVALDQALKQTITWERAHPPESIDLKKFDYSAEDESIARIEAD
jgi:nucleoside-diphosphate-sugar epimerase